METRFVTIKDGEPSMATPFSFSALASENFPAGSIVGMLGPNSVGPASAGGVASAIGFVLDNALANNPVRVYSLGKVPALFVTTTGLGSIPIPVYLDSGGYVTPVPPTTGEVKQVGLGYLDGATPMLWFQPQLSLFLS